MDKQAAVPCKHGDKAYPCQDGDPCHYEGENPMPTPAASPVAGVSAEPIGLMEAVHKVWRSQIPSGLVRTVWKDGIDIDIPTAELVEFAVLLQRAQSSAEGDGGIAAKLGFIRDGLTLLSKRQALAPYEFAASLAEDLQTIIAALPKEEKGSGE